MGGLKGVRTLMRVHVRELDTFDGQAVYKRVVQLLHSNQLAGAIAYRTVAGFGATGELHHERTWAIRDDVPVVIECVDMEEKIVAVLPEIDRILDGGLITLESVRVILFRKEESTGDEEADSVIDFTGHWQ